MKKKKIILPLLISVPAIGGIVFTSNLIKAETNHEEDKEYITPGGIKYTYDDRFYKIIKDPVICGDCMYWNINTGETGFGDCGGRIKLTDEGLEIIQKAVEEKGYSFDPNNIYASEGIRIYKKDNGQYYGGTWQGNITFHYFYNNNYEYYSSGKTVVSCYGTTNERYCINFGNEINNCIEEYTEPSWVWFADDAASIYREGDYYTLYIPNKKVPIEAIYRHYDEHESLKVLTQSENLELLTSAVFFNNQEHSLEKINYSPKYYPGMTQYVFQDTPFLCQETIQYFVDKSDFFGFFCNVYNGKNFKIPETRQQMNISFSGLKTFSTSAGFNCNYFNTLDLSNCDAVLYGCDVFINTKTTHIIGPRTKTYDINEFCKSHSEYKEILNWEDKDLQQLRVAFSSSSQYSSKLTKSLKMSQGEKVFLIEGFPDIEYIETFADYINNGSQEYKNLTNLIFNKDVKMIENSTAPETLTEDEFKKYIEDNHLLLTDKPFAYSSKEKVNEEDYKNLNFVEYNGCFEEYDSETHTKNYNHEKKISIAKISNGVIVKTFNYNWQTKEYTPICYKYEYNPNLVVSVPANSNIEKYCKKWNYITQTVKTQSALDISSAYNYEDAIIKNNESLFTVVLDTEETKTKTKYQFGSDIVQIKNNLTDDNGSIVPSKNLKFTLTDIDDNPIDFNGTSLSKLKKYLNNCIPTTGGVYKIILQIKDKDTSEDPIILSISNIEELPFKINSDGKTTLYQNNNGLNDYINILLTKDLKDININKIKVLDNKQNLLSVKVSIEDNKLLFLSEEKIDSDSLNIYYDNNYIGKIDLITSDIKLLSNEANINESNIGVIKYFSNVGIKNISLKNINYVDALIEDNKIKLSINDKNSFINEYGDSIDGTLILNDEEFPITINIDNSKILSFLNDKDISESNNPINIYKGSLILTNEQNQKLINFAKDKELSVELSYGYLYYVYSQSNHVGIEINIDEYITKYINSISKWTTHPEYKKLTDESDKQEWLINHLVSNNYNILSNKTYKILYLSEYFK